MSQDEAPELSLDEIMTHPLGDHSELAPSYVISFNGGRIVFDHTGKSPFEEE
jgi:hypothetical protein